MKIKTQIDINRLPKHIAIIMDGNGRWAKKHGKSRVFGHRNGVKSVRVITEKAAELGIEYLTLYTFSTENWERPKTEVNALMALLVDTIKKEIDTLNKNDIRLQTIGDIAQLPKRSYQALLDGIEKTKNNKKMTLVLALNYSAKWEMVQAVKKIATDVKNNKYGVDDIDASTFANALCTKNIPDPELLIRTSGETRISNFLLWQIAYSELYFTPVLWPDFREKQLYEAIIDYQGRERRFGKTSEQLK